ncbi:MAG: substrate-binding domain-containing protein [Muribaculaceae bacterium]|nr:substrate-binding domain-containing protein [Muribaculaceae bacterium]
MKNHRHSYKSIKAMSLGVILAAFAIACSPVKRGEYVDGSATMYCDDGFRHILQEEIEVFEYQYPNSAIIPFYVDEQTAMDSLLENKTQLVVTTHELTQDQIKYIKDKYRRVVRQSCIAVDAVALIVNKDNPVNTLTLTDIKEIISGKISKWNQLAVPGDAGIRLVFDNQGSSTVSYMREKFLGENGKVSDNPNAFAQKDNAEVFDIVKKDKNAIGIISVSWLGADLSEAKNVPVEKRMADYAVENDTVATNLTTEVKILKVANPIEGNDFSTVAYMPYQAYINSGEYPLYRKVYMISTATGSSVLNSFYQFSKGFIGQKIISKTGILPYHMSARMVNLK